MKHTYAKQHDRGGFRGLNFDGTESIFECDYCHVEATGGQLFGWYLNDHEDIHFCPICAKKCCTAEQFDYARKLAAQKLKLETQRVQTAARNLNVAKKIFDEVQATRDEFRNLFFQTFGGN